MRTKKILALLLVAVMLFSFVQTAFAAQSSEYQDPAESWTQANNRTNELDINSVVTHETFYCYECKQPTSFLTFRVPEYTRSGQTALNRGVMYSDGTLIGGTGKGNVDDGLPGVNATYTGYHWCKSVCETCGLPNTNLAADYSAGKNVYILYDCAAEFMRDLPEIVNYKQIDNTYHLKTTTHSECCLFCFGTHAHSHSVLEPHNMRQTVIP